MADRSLLLGRVGTTVPEMVDEVLYTDASGAATGAGALDIPAPGTAGA